MALPMTDTPERELIERLAVAIREEQVRQHRDDERGKCPAGAAFYEEHVGPYQIATVVMRELEALLSRVDKLEERLTNCFNIACDYTICERDAPRFTERPKGTLIWKGASDDNQ